MYSQLEKFEKKIYDLFKKNWVKKVDEKIEPFITQFRERELRDYK